MQNEWETNQIDKNSNNNNPEKISLLSKTDKILLKSKEKTQAVAEDALEAVKPEPIGIILVSRDHLIVPFTLKNLI